MRHKELQEKINKLIDKFANGEIAMDEYVEEYNRLQSEYSSSCDPPEPHEHI